MSRPKQRPTARNYRRRKRRSGRASAGSALDQDRVAVDPDLIGRHIRRRRTVDELAGADVELGEMQRALDDVSVEPAARQRRIAVPANVAERVKPPVDMSDHDALTLD